jgi:hypothetical protein
VLKGELKVVFEDVLIKEKYNAIPDPPKLHFGMTDFSSSPDHLRMDEKTNKGLSDDDKNLIKKKISERLSFQYSNIDYVIKKKKTPIKSPTSGKIQKMEAFSNHIFF